MIRELTFPLYIIYNIGLGFKSRIPDLGTQKSPKGGFSEGLKVTPLHRMAPRYYICIIKIKGDPIKGTHIINLLIYYIMATSVKTSKAATEQKELAALKANEITNEEALALIAKATPEALAQAKKDSKKATKVPSTKEPKAKKATTLDAISAQIPTQVLKGATSMRNSIYKAEIFEGLSDKEKKTARRKLRRNRDAFIATFLECGKDQGKLKALQKQWTEYASQVYNNISYIFEKNTVEDNQDICSKFVKAMDQEYK